MCAQGNKVTNPPCTIMDYTVNFIFYSYDKDKNALAKTLQNKVMSYGLYLGTRSLTW